MSIGCGPSGSRPEPHGATSGCRTLPRPAFRLARPVVVAGLAVPGRPSSPVGPACCGRADRAVAWTGAGCRTGGVRTALRLSRRQGVRETHGHDGPHPVGPGGGPDGGGAGGEHRGTAPAARSGAASGEAPGDHDHHHRDAAQRELHHTSRPMPLLRRAAGGKTGSSPGGARPSRHIVRRFDEPAGPGVARPAEREDGVRRDGTAGLPCREPPHASGAAGGVTADEPR